ncbi:MAG: galactose mutarotase [Spirochaetaceae bacterium]|jgi:aldose 1-epimerase|nr:galactose mutarotase [Spirochaetaceae bacterium]
MQIKKKTFGRLYTGERVDLYTLKAGEISFSITTFGARWVSLITPSKRGKADILLGYATLDAYARDTVYLGSTVGRFANRIAGAAFTLDGKAHTLSRNDGAHTLHGGRRGFDRRVWKAEPYEEKDGVFLRLELDSPAGDQGFPGKCRAAVSYGLTKSGEIVADFHAILDEPSPVNLTNHAYFNLAGEGEGDILSHLARFPAPHCLESTPEAIPTGVIIPTEGTPFDFARSRPIGRDFPALRAEYGFDGYDHCFIPEGECGTFRLAGEIIEPVSGRTLVIHSTQPGFHFYTGNYLDGLPGKPGSVYGKYGGFCIETEHFPDAPNRSGFPSAVFGPGKVYNEKTVYSFTW